MAVGKSVLRVDGRDKVTGQAKFIDDYKMAGLLHGAVLRSPIAYGEILEINSKKAENFPGVKAVLTAGDIPGCNIVPLVVPDQPFFAEQFVRFHGEAVAAVVAENAEIAHHALSLIEVKYRELEPLLSIEASMEPGAREIHQPGNIFKTYQVLKGNPETALQEAEVIIENEYRTTYQEHAYLETNGALAVPESDRITVYGSMQCPFYVQGAVAAILNYPLNKVRVIQAETGGGFGGKEDVPSLVAGMASLMAWKVKRPVKYILSRKEDLLAMSKRHPAVIKYKTGAKKTGEITAVEVEYLIDGGAYTTLSTIVLFRGVVHAPGPYRIPNVRVVGKAVATNKLPCGAYRGFGSPQVIFACESQMDELAAKLGMDPLELRKLNALKPGDETAWGQEVSESMGFWETMEKAEKSCNWTEKRRAYQNQTGDLRKGIGVSTFLYGVGLDAHGAYLARAGAFVQVCSDGTVQAAVGTVEMGQGMNTALSQILAEALGCEVEQVYLMEADTSRVPDSGPTVASRATLSSGNALMDAARQLKERLMAGAAEEGKIPQADLELSGGYLKQKSTSRELMDFCKLVHILSKKRVHLTAQGWWVNPYQGVDLETGLGIPYNIYTWVTQIAEVEVDLQTGETRVEHFTSAHDIGKAVNPLALEGQIEGGVLQGIGYGLCEDFIYDAKGRALTLDFATYIIPTMADAPEITPIIVEHPYSQGPFGAKGVGETPLMGAAPAVTNAIRQACGVVIRHLPATPEKIFGIGN